MRTWLGQVLSVGDKVYKAGYGGSRLYFYVGEIVTHRPGSNKVGVVTEINHATQWIGSTPKTSIHFPSFATHWQGGPPRPTSVGLDTLLKLDDQEYKNMVERTKIAAQVVDKAANGGFGVLTTQKFNIELVHAWTQAGL